METNIAMCIFKPIVNQCRRNDGPCKSILTPSVGDSGAQQCVEEKLVLGRILAKYCDMSSGKTYHCDEVFGHFSSIHVPIYKEWHNLA